MPIRVVVALVAALVASSCTGGGGARLTTRELVRNANRVCAETNRTISTFSAVDPLDSAGSAAVLGRVVREQRTALSRLRRLAPQERDARAFRQWLDRIELVLAQSEASRRAIRDGDVRDAAVANRRGDDLRREADRFAAKLGLAACVAG